MKLGQIEDDDFDAPAEAMKNAEPAESATSQEAMDSMRREFLNDLDISTKINLSDWEADFIGSNLQRRSFSPKQRDIINKLVKKYGDRIDS